MTIEDILRAEAARQIKSALRTVEREHPGSIGPGAETMVDTTLALTLDDRFKLVGELPGEGPWKLVPFRNGVIALSPNAEPQWVCDGKITPIRLGVEVGQPAATE